MKHRIHVAGALVLAILAGPARAQAPQRVRHVPPAESEPGQPLKITASVDRGWEANLEIRYRPQGASAWQGATFTREDQSTYAVTIPGEAMTPPGIEYFIMSSGQVQALHFASAEAPHRVNVFLARVEVRRMTHLARHHNRRAQIMASGEWVDYGRGDIDRKRVPDRYYRVDAAVGYRVLSFPLKTLRFGYTQLIGKTLPEAAIDPNFACQPSQTGDQCAEEVGFRGGGWFELNFLLGDNVELDTRGMVMASQEGFNVGGRAELRIGNTQGSHLGLGVERINTVGTAGFVRLAWGTVPKLPMAATVEVTNFPATYRDTAVRLIYDVAYPLPSGFRVGVRGGYQAREQRFGGATLGLNASLEF